MKRVIAVLLAWTTFVCAGDFAILNLRVVEGEGMVYATASRATRGITVEVTDETGRPVAGVTVSFKLPDDGPTGLFGNGTRTEVVSTGADGRAAVWGMKWGKAPGTCQVRITAVKDNVRAGIVSTQHLSDTPEIRASRPVGRRHSKLLLIGIAAAGAAGGGLAMGMSRSATKPAISPTVPLSVGSPTVIVGAP